MSLYSEYYLFHHGVKGMKWGVRKEQRTESTSKTRRLLKPYTPEKKAQIKANRNFNLALATASSLAVGTGYALQATRGRSVASEVLKGAGKGLAISTISTVAIEQGRLIVDQQLRGDE